MAVAEQTKKLAKAFTKTEPELESDNGGPTGRVIVEYDEFQAARLIVLLWMQVTENGREQVTENGRECFTQIRNPKDELHGVDVYVSLHKEGPLVDMSINDNGIVVTIPELSFRNLQELGTFFLKARQSLLFTYEHPKPDPKPE